MSGVLCSGSNSTAFSGCSGTVVSLSGGMLPVEGLVDGLPVKAALIASEVRGSKKLSGSEGNAGRLASSFAVA